MSERAKERPILFSGPMVRALLDGRKTQTRRAVKLREFGRSDTRGYDWTFRDRRALWNDVSDAWLLERCPYGVPGERLWVRETWCSKWDDAEGFSETETFYAATDGHIVAVDDDGGQKWNKDGFEASPWKPSIHMPRSRSRLTLEVTEVRVQRLHDISEDDARAEGVEPAPFCKSGRPAGNEHVEAFEDLWGSINGPDSWNANPWVWVINFRPTPKP